ncbi:unnamed protein product [Bursaphelenchus okinawaensis]|uniref:3-hydroxyacyl-CoA dehydrogenase C-terminal domain-containing protein n=1 Tax=Bursaphelenchus okinawaensis TaxID=465554 RepID=A0A811KB62_9BILA|nr:unnamed protein product [Bursaphelenchus okinawaensis]CAG9097364.1 unnamed protein product [Bursaphelenchus okinawaensis]
MLPITSFTSQKTVDDLTDLASLFSKRVIKCKDSPGFVVNRLLCPMINAAHRLVDEGVVDDYRLVDEVIKDCLGWKMGPFEVSDFVGLQSLENIIREMENQLPKGVIVESQVLKEAMIRQLNTGNGFYERRSQ